MSILKMTADKLTTLFGSDASEQLEIALNENGISTDHPTWEEVFIELNAIELECIDDDFEG